MRGSNSGRRCSRNRTKRQRRGEFLVQGVRPIAMAIAHGWQIRELLHDTSASAVRLGTRALDTVRAERFAVSA